MDPLTIALILGTVAFGAVQQQQALSAQKDAQRAQQIKENMRMSSSIKGRQQQAETQALTMERTRNSQKPITSNGLDVGAATVVGSSGTF